MSLAQNNTVNKEMRHGSIRQAIGILTPAMLNLETQHCKAPYGFKISKSECKRLEFKRSKFF